MASKMASVRIDTYADGIQYVGESAQEGFRHVFPSNYLQAT